MVDFEKLKKSQSRPRAIDPAEIFRRLPKPPGINDLYRSQAEVLGAWFERKDERDIVVKLHTGGGKTLVGLLMAQSTINEHREPVLYLAPTVQLVGQALEKAKDMGIPAVPYRRGQPLHDDFVNGKAVMIATYRALFNGRSRFGLRGDRIPQSVYAVILDDAHAAFSVVRDAFTLDVRAEADRTQYENLVELFRKAFKDVDRLGTLEDIVEGAAQTVLEVPYWAWHDKLDEVRQMLTDDSEDYGLVWPLLRDNLRFCHALVSSRSFTITPVLPLVNAFPTFVDAHRRIYMSATMADDSEIVRTFDADASSVMTALTSRSLAGISERMILIPDLMPFQLNMQDAAEELMTWTVGQDLGAVILVPSDRAAEEWSETAGVAKGSEQVERLVAELQNGTTRGPVVFANRYDGIDLPGDSCRLLILAGLPTGNSNYELYRSRTLYGSATAMRMLAQRIEQGAGRGSRGAGDHCVVLLTGTQLAAWVAKEANFRFLTSATRAQLEMGVEISRSVNDLSELVRTIGLSFERDKNWTEYHAETLAALVDEELPDEMLLQQAAAERKAVNRWLDGYPERAIATIEKALAELDTLDSQTRGWMGQLAARVAQAWGDSQRAEDLQRQAFAENRNMFRPRVPPPYQPLAAPDEQARALAGRLGGYRIRRGYLQSFEETVVHLHKSASSNQFEQALADLGTLIGLSTERHDTNGEGPDVLWLLPDKAGFVIEAKSRKKAKNAFTKEDHGQLLVAVEWFKKHYPDYRYVGVCVHPANKATKAAVGGASHALTYAKLAALITEARELLVALCESQLADEPLEAKCASLLQHSPLRHDRLEASYLQRFEEQE